MRHRIIGGAAGGQTAEQRGNRRSILRPASARAKNVRKMRMRHARTSERRLISSWVMRRCNVFSALPGSDMKRKPS